MSINKVESCERTKLERFLNKVQLPNSYRKFGIFIALTSFIGLIVFKFVDDRPDWTVNFIKHSMLIGLLMVSLSREKIEDELIEILRSKSYALAFIIGVGYTLLQPLANLVVNTLMGTDEAPDSIGYIQVLLLLLMIQVGFFEVLKRNR